MKFQFVSLLMQMSADVEMIDTSKQSIAFEYNFNNNWKHLHYCEPIYF